MISVRIDKWRWAARFFKTRALAQKACDLGRIRSNGIETKPAREVCAGDVLPIENEGGEFNVEVLLPSPWRRVTPPGAIQSQETAPDRETSLNRIGHLART